MALRVPPSRGQGPDAEARLKAKSLIVAECFDEKDMPVVRAELTGANGYTFTAEMLAWLADSIAKGKLKETGAVGPVEAFGMDELIEGCCQAGLKLQVSKVASPENLFMVFQEKVN
jgi:short subunit dehydrogenase-like uncharacterized protein